MKILIITGLSGAGKSKATEYLEDMGYYCVDNLPPKLIPVFYDLCLNSKEKQKAKHAAIVSDIRGTQGNFDDLFSALKSLKEKNYPFKLLFLEAKDDIIVQRYRLTRRKHPFVNINSSSVSHAIETERTILKPVREIADYIIDTSFLSNSQLRYRISELFLEKTKNILNVNCMSFGFKYGPPSEANIVFDVRCFPNPYYDHSLRELTGLDDQIKEFVLQKESTKSFVGKLFYLLDFVLPLYIKEGKSQLVIAIGCTGGKHRSVAIVNLLYEHLTELGYCCGVSHRDIQKK